VGVCGFVFDHNCGGSDNSYYIICGSYDVEIKDDMKVWDSRTQKLTPEWLAHSSLAKDLKLGDVMILGCGNAKVVGLEYVSGFVEIHLEYMDMDEDDGGSASFLSNQDGRFMIVPRESQ
jgi:hypothetical protein